METKAWQKPKTFAEICPDYQERGATTTVEQFGEISEAIKTWQECPDLEYLANFSRPNFNPRELLQFYESCYESGELAAQF